MPHKDPTRAKECAKKNYFKRKAAGLVKQYRNRENQVRYGRIVAFFVRAAITYWVLRVRDRCLRESHRLSKVPFAGPGRSSGTATRATPPCATPFGSW